ncbi:MAG: hypothetical protein JNL74_22790 [Fibrobacteres bacterium]|nr:hypothetical protein [Fibrobacterota bacterium]
MKKRSNSKEKSTVENNSYSSFTLDDMFGYNGIIPFNRFCRSITVVCPYCKTSAFVANFGPLHALMIATCKDKTCNSIFLPFAGKLVRLNKEILESDNAENISFHLTLSVFRSIFPSLYFWVKKTNMPEENRIPFFKRCNEIIKEAVGNRQTDEEYWKALLNEIKNAKGVDKLILIEFMCDIEKQYPGLPAAKEVKIIPKYENSAPVKEEDTLSRHQINDLIIDIENSNTIEEFLRRIEGK